MTNKPLKVPSGRNGTRYVLFVLLLLLIATRQVNAAEFPTNALILPFSDDRIFSSITLSNDIVVVGIPLTQTVFTLFVNGTRIGFAEPLKTVSLRSGDTIELTQEHGASYSGPFTTIHAEVEIITSEAQLRAIKTFDATALKEGVTVQYFVFRQEKK